MLAILSPAKNIGPAPAPAGMEPTRPDCMERTRAIAAQLRLKSAWELESLLGISPRLALAALAMHQSMDPDLPGSPAAAAFQGLAYRHLSAGDFTAADYAYGAHHLRILSAFYGLLRPGDGIHPYRLDFSNGLKMDGKTLYDYWGDEIARRVFLVDDTVIDLASAEYARCLLRHPQPGTRIIKVDFLLPRRGRLTTLATEAKMCRGAMARFIIKNRLDAPEQLRDFTHLGYAYAPGLSSPQRMVFEKEPL